MHFIDVFFHFKICMHIVPVKTLTHPVIIHYFPNFVILIKASKLAKGTSGMDQKCTSYKSIEGVHTKHLLSGFYFPSGPTYPLKENKKIYSKLIKNFRIQLVLSANLISIVSAFRSRSRETKKCGKSIAL